MAEWLVEHGIGEERALLVEGDEVLAAKMRWPGELAAGSMIVAKLAAKPSRQTRGLAIDPQGREVLIDRLPAGVTEGCTIRVEITRAPIAERGRLKRAQGRVAGEKAFGDQHLTGEIVQRFPVGLWEEVWDIAGTGEIAFPGGALLFSVTPAMTVVDVDGALPPRELALTAIPALARGLRLLDIGGSIAIDFPTLAAKADRKAVDAALEEALGDWPHERTAMNGFGLVQIVARLEGPSLLHRLALSRAGASARTLLRRAEALDGAGAVLLLAHPAALARLRPEWLDELARRTGREVRTQADPALALESGHAQLVSR